MKIGSISGSIVIPLRDLSACHGELHPERPGVCIGHHGIRSGQAVAILARLEFRRVFNLSGGLDRWTMEVDPSMSRP